MYHGSGGGMSLDRLWPMGLDRGDWWVWITGGWWVSRFGSVLCVWIGAVGLDRRYCGSVLWVWISAIVAVSCDCGCW